MLTSRISQFNLAALTTALALVSTSGFALEALDDEVLAQSTGEGLGIVLKDFKLAADPTTYVRLTSADGSRPLKLAKLVTDADGNSAYTEVLKDASGNPVYKKGEIYMYGYSIGGTHARNKGGGVGDEVAGGGVAGAYVGSVDNPAVLDVKDIDGKSTLVLNFPKVADGTHPASSKINENLKLVSWVDVLPRKAGDVTVDVTRKGAGTYSTVDYPNYLRMQTMAKGLSLDGTQVNLYKTGEFDTGAAIDTGVASLNTYLAAENARMKVAYSNKVANYGKLRINYETDDSDSANTGFYSSDISKSGYFKWSVAQTANDKGDFGTNPAAVNNTNISGNQYGAYVASTPPTFNDKEGLFVKDFQINMPLGSKFQPTILDTNGDGSITLETARIPNISAIYERHYVKYPQTTYNHVTKDANTTLTYNTTTKGLDEAAGTTTTTLPSVNALTVAEGYCTPTSCPDTATHATAYFRTFTHDKAGGFTKDYARVGTEPYMYRGYGVKGDATGFAGIGQNGALSTLEANTTPTYNMAEGMVVNHLKITLNQ